MKATQKEFEARTMRYRGTPIRESIRPICSIAFEIGDDLQFDWFSDHDGTVYFCKDGTPYIERDGQWVPYDCIPEND